MRVHLLVMAASDCRRGEAQRDQPRNSTEGQHTGSPVTCAHAASGALCRRCGLPGRTVAWSMSSLDEVLDTPAPAGARLVAKEMVDDWLGTLPRLQTKATTRGSTTSRVAAWRKLRSWVRTFDEGGGKAHAPAVRLCRRRPASARDTEVMVDWLKNESGETLRFAIRAREAGASQARSTPRGLTHARTRPPRAARDEAVALPPRRAADRRPQCRHAVLVGVRRRAAPAAQ